MTMEWIIITVLISFILGTGCGRTIEAKKWREKGDHQYMNTKESWGRLYTVKYDSRVE